MAYLGSVLKFPFPDEFEELIPIFRGMDLGHFEKNLPELPSIGSLRDVTAPDQSLSLDVDKATLHSHTRPEALENVGQVRVAVNGEAAGAQTPLFQTFQECPELRPRAFGDSILAGDQCMRPRIHQRHKATRAMNKCSVQDEVLVLLQARDGLWRRLLKVMIDHMVKLSRTVPALTSQLPDRVTFDNPAPEPLLFVGFSDFGITPTKRALTPGAIPSLPAVGVMAVSPGDTGTPWTVFF